jgi:hypothetical protein
MSGLLTESPEDDSSRNPTKRVLLETGEKFVAGG